jgi:hypothetical protein
METFLTITFDGKSYNETKLHSLVPARFGPSNHLSVCAFHKAHNKKTKLKKYCVLYTTRLYGSFGLILQPPWWAHCKKS